MAMNVSFESPKPEVKVYYDSQASSKALVDQIVLGIEEEGVPYSIVAKSDLTSGLYLGYKAAEASHLGVGIGVGDKIVLHYIKLTEDNPLFTVARTNDLETLRAIGSNAARIVKRMPFKSIE